MASSSLASAKMKILLLTHSFNSLAQRIFVLLKELKHEVSVEYDISDSVTIHAAEIYRPNLIIAPFLKRAVPSEVYKKIPTLIIHPGPPGDRGPSSLDWAILTNAPQWGVTVLQANEVMDGGPIWAYQKFKMRNATKGSIYRQEIGDAAEIAVKEALLNWGPIQKQNFEPVWRPQIKQSDRKIDWSNDSRELIIRKINSADGSPGLLGEYQGRELYLYNVQNDLRIGHIKEKGVDTFKIRTDNYSPSIKATIEGDVTTIWFNFYNGAMNCSDCKKLLAAYKNVTTPVVLLRSESGFFSNGIDLNYIEAADNPSDESWKNINAMDDLVEEIIRDTKKISIAYLEGNVSAGGVFLARACDLVYSKKSVILNPHYKNMGNLYGSEFWTYLFPKYSGKKEATRVINERVPMGVIEAKQIGLIDTITETLNLNFDRISLLREKQTRREQDEKIKPLSLYREEELQMMHENFYGSDPSYHLARSNFVRKVVKSKTPLHLAIHRKK